MPSQPGVYWFLGENKKILYVGKAKNLKKRVRSYRNLKRLSTRKQQLVKEAAQLKHQVLDSELEALLVEAELIRIHQPQYNILLKDDKSPIYVHISDDDYPQIQMVRRKEIYKQDLKGTILGPFKSAYQLKQVLHLARKIFTWCDKAASRINRRTKDNLQPCFYYHIDQCPGACVDQISAEDYQKNIEQLILFLKGKKRKVLSQLKNKMEQAANKLEYEQAGKIKKKIEIIKQVTDPKYRLKPDLILPKLHQSQAKNSLIHLKRILTDFIDIPRHYQLDRIEGYDASNIQGKNAAVSMVCFTDGQPDKSNYRLFNIRSIDTPNDYQMIKEAVARRQKHPEWGKPKLTVIDGGKGQLRAALSIWGWSSPIISIAKNPDRLIIPTNHYRDKQTNRLKIQYRIIRLPENHPTLQLIQRIRDESHRFAKKQHTRLRQKNLLK